MKKFLKVLLIIICVLIVLLMIHFVRNYIIIKDVLVKTKQYEGVTNFYYEIKNTEDDKTAKIYTKNYKKDMISLVEIENGDRSIKIWKDVSNNESVVIFTGKGEALIGTEDTVLEPQIPLFEGNPYVSLISLVYSEKIDGQDCVVIQIGESKWWINKETGLYAKIQSGTQYVDGEESPIVVEYKNWKINQLTDKDVEKPDLTGYKVTENK